MPCGKGPLTPSPNSPAKAISHMVLFGEQFVLIPQLVGIACGSIRGVVWCIWQKLRWDRVCVYAAVWDTLSWIETALQWYGAIAFPIGFLMVSNIKRQQFQCGEPWVKEALVLTIKLACAVKTHWQMRVPRLTRFALTTWSISTFTCKYYPFDSSNGFWKINMI